MKLAFWNVKGNTSAAVMLADQPAAPDLIALAECAEPDLVETALRAIDEEWRRMPETGHRVAIYHRPSVGGVWLRDIVEGGAIIELRPPSAPALLVVAVHLKSQLHLTPQRLSTQIGKLRKAIVQAEARADHRNTILMGDLNLDPFALGLNDRELLLGTMDRRQARRLAERRTMQDATFYNPMWSRLGDESPGPPGTWHTSRDSDGEHFFHTFDQVLLRPALIARFYGLEVPRTLGKTTLVTQNDIPRARISDHLPIIFNLS